MTDDASGLLYPGRVGASSLQSRVLLRYEREQEDVSQFSVRLHGVVAQLAFQVIADALGNPSAPPIPSVAADLDAAGVQHVEGEGGDGADGFADVSLALK